MKTIELNDKQLDKIFEYRPYWMAKYRPEWMAKHRPAWMADHRQDWIADHRAYWLANHRPDCTDVPDEIMKLLEGN